MLLCYLPLPSLSRPYRLTCELVICRTEETVFVHLFGHRVDYEAIRGPIPLVVLSPNLKSYTSAAPKTFNMAPPTAIDINVEGVTDTQAIVMPDPLTMESVAGHRLKTPKMSGGVAAFACSDMWKTPVRSIPRPR